MKKIIEKIKIGLKKFWKWILVLIFGTIAMAGINEYVGNQVLLDGYKFDVNTVQIENIDTFIAGLPANLKAKVKGYEIAKLKHVPKTNVKFSGADYDIEILSFEPIEGGVELYARAWYPDGTPVGFGKDGTVEIERFRFINPPVLIDNPSGKIVRHWTDANGVKYSRKLKQDYKLAILQSLAHTIKVSTKDNPKGQIIKGKRGHTTSTFYPDPDPETNTVDGWVNRSLAESWTNKRNGAGNEAADNATSSFWIGLMANASPPNWENMIRGIAGFNTSSIPDSDPVTSATLSIYGSSKVDNFSQSVVVDRNIPSSNTSLANSDYNIGNWDGVEQATNRITIASWDTAGYNDFTLNSTGKNNIDKTGNSWFGLRGSGDFDNSEPTHPGGAAWMQAQGYHADESGTTKDPKLVVVHGAAPPPPTKPHRHIIEESKRDIKPEDTIETYIFKIFNQAEIG